MRDYASEDVEKESTGVQRFYEPLPKTYKLKRRRLPYLMRMNLILIVEEEIKVALITVFITLSSIGYGAVIFRISEIAILN